MVSNRLQPFDPANVTLRGQRLIEASAGTGKTYTIAALYLRLIVESGLPVGRILVVTFTNAATAELADRIRNRLATARQALEHCTHFTAIDDDLLRELALRSTLQPDALRRRLENALRGFDEAAIFTIHGFCQRVLADRAFASGMAFETELEVDPSDRLSEIAADFWRRNFYRAEPLLVDWLLAKGYTPDKLLTDIQSHLGKPYLQLRQAAATQDLQEIEQRFSAAYAALRTTWASGREQVKQCLTEAIQHGVLKINVYKIDPLPDWLEQLDDYLRPPQPNLNLPSKFEYFTTQKLAASLRKGRKAPQHDCFEHCQALSQAQVELHTAFEARLYHLRAKLLHYTNEQLGVRKQRDQKQSYDDLLLNLDRALDDATLGPQLANAVRKHYPAALIDEFQDTDPLQYGIFQRIYADSDCPLFLVGDPKQAIYSFRGADIFAYLQAHHKAHEQLTLTYNWRSTPDLIKAVNTLFSQHHAPFLLPDISFYPVSAAEKTDARRLWIKDDDPAPLRLWFLHDTNEPKRGALIKGKANPWVAEACAAEIARLLNLAAAGQAYLGDQCLHGGDIAVLVRTHEEGTQIRQALLALGIPSVQRSRDNVLATAEAEQLQHLLSAILNPAHDGWVRAALATDLLGFDAAALLRCEQDERAWEQQLDHLLDLQQIWQRRGFAPLFRQLLRAWAIPERLLSLDDGERRLTNLLHLGELLGAAALRERLLPETLLSWLAHRRQMAAKEVEEYQLRLESDEQLVHIATLHKSKGLQYPIVFYPFGWSSGRGIAKQAAVPFHDPESDYQAVLDLGSGQQSQARNLAEQERLAENLRLLYVGLTRAEQRCYLGWGLINTAEDGALTWLLHQPPDASSAADRFVAVQTHYKTITADTLRQQLNDLARRAPACIRVSEPPALPGQRYHPPKTEELTLQARHFTGSLDGHWRIGSFTALTRHIGHAERPLLPVERPDHDALAEVDSEPTVNPLISTDRSIADFPRGARAGSCLHEILEMVDFTQPTLSDNTLLVDRTLHRYGFAIDWAPVVAAMVERVLSTPLDGAGLRLCQIPRTQRLDELEFHYPVGVPSAKLNDVLLRYGDWPPAIREHITRLDVELSAGYMKGFIDLVFEADGRYYLLDYKSNWLGRGVEDYHPDALATAMADSAYYLQYLLYTLALHRYLRLRLPHYQYARDFGGVFYLFLRGMVPDRPHLGVYADRPEPALIDALDGML